MCEMQPRPYGNHWVSKGGRKPVKRGGSPRVSKGGRKPFRRGGVLLVSKGGRKHVRRGLSCGSLRVDVSLSDERVIPWVSKGGQPTGDLLSRSSCLYDHLINQGILISQRRHSNEISTSANNPHLYSPSDAMCKRCSFECDIGEYSARSVYIFTERVLYFPRGMKNDQPLSQRVRGRRNLYSIIIIYYIVNYNMVQDTSIKTVNR